MPRFEVDWALYGTATIEAESEDEAVWMLQTGLANLDSTLFEEFDVDEVEAQEISEVDTSEDQ